MLDVNAKYSSKNYGDFVVLKYIDCENVVVKFVDTSYIMTTQASNIKRGSLKDPFYPRVFGVGFVGVGEHKATDGKVNSKIYSIWKAMIARCYSEKVQDKHPTYVGCSVCIEWHNFQNFAEWFELNRVDGYHLDKDIKIDGNKVYSPDACMFVSKADNNIKARAKHYTFNSPSGDVVDIYNMMAFCKDNNLSFGNMCSVSKGNRKHHKGWTI